MSPGRPLLSLLSLTALVILACGGLGDTGWEEPECDASCPAWTVQLDGDDDEDNACFSTCEPMVDCPSWGVPLISESCYSCSHVTEAGQLLPLTPNIGRGSFDDACSTPADSGATHTLMWIDERFTVSDGELEGDVHILWTAASDRSVLCDVRFRATSSAVDEGCPECDLEIGAELELWDLDGPECDAILTGWRYDLIDSADGGRLLFGYAKSWTSWDGVVHDNVVFRFDFDLIYDASPWIPYSQAEVTGSGDLPDTIATHEIWVSEHIDLRSGYSGYRQQHGDTFAPESPLYRRAWR